MDKKSALRSEIDGFILAEEEALPIYSKHLSSALFWSGLADEEQKKIRASLEILAKETKEHIKILKSVKERL